MANIKEEKLRSLKHSNIAASIAGLITLGVIIFVAFASMLSVFAVYIMDAKVRDEYNRVSQVAELYLISEADPGTSRGPADDYIITDEAGKIIKEHGTNTCDLASGGKMDVLEIAGAADAVEAQLSEDATEINDIKDIYDLNDGIAQRIRDNVITVYPDIRYPIIKTGKGGRVSPDFPGLGRALRALADQADDESVDETGYIRLPYWIEIPLNGGMHMVCKASFDINYRELTILGTLLVIVVIISIALLVFMIVFLCRNLKNRKRMQEVFFMDEITGGHNWMWFLSNAEEELKKKSNSDNRYAVLDIVFVNYRNFCVCHSVAEGEEMLRLVGDKIEEHLQKGELYAHHSAAHFAALLIYTDTASLEERIRKMTADLEKVNSDHKFNFWVGVDRIGILSDENSGKVNLKDVDIEHEYNNAGAARASITGDDSAIAFFDAKMVEEQKWIDTINENQEKALANEEFLVYYQPKYDPRTNTLKGAEALIRWKSPAHDGLIPPGRFIPIFEKNGFITKIDHYMLEHVARDQKEWLDKGYSCVPVSVNVSRAHFIEDDLAEQIRDIVDREGTPHDLIEIELTESAFFDDKNALITTIKKLKGYGFTVSMDDFGSGYSSLNSLKEIPLDVLKLDADFFRNDSGDGRDRIIVSEAINLARKLSMRTVAEGVEEKDQVDFLAREGCDMIQGYYFAKPMPKEEYAGKMGTSDM